MGLRAVVILITVMAASIASAGPGDGVLPTPPTRGSPPPKSNLGAMRSACELARPDCDPSALLSRLERRAVDRALAERHLTIDHAPYHKPIGRILISTSQVFGPDEGVLRLLNVFHVTTKADVVRRGLVFGQGDPWDQHRIDESARTLRDPTSTSLVAIVPIVSSTPGAVDVLVVTRDVWSIRLNSDYELQGSLLTLLSFDLSENNLLGWHKFAALSFRMDPATYEAGPYYVDRDMFGRHLQLIARGGPIFNRDSLGFEGSESTVSFGRPLWSLASRWAATLDWTHRFTINRTFSDTGVATYDDPRTPGDDQVPWQYRQHLMTLTATVTRGWGEDVSQRINGGYALGVQRPSLLASFPADATLRRDFTTDVLPRSERTSALFVGYQIFASRYRNFQNITSFDLAEDTRMGVTAEVSAAVGLGLLGSDSNFVKLSGSLGYTGQLGGDGMWRITTTGATRLERGHVEGLAIDNAVTGDVRLVSPTFGPLRLLSEATVSGVYRDTQNQLFTLGGDNGLRGYPIDFLKGAHRRALWETELRTRPEPIGFSRWGLLAFHDLGGAAASFRSMAIYQDVGVGVRMLLPELEASVFRFDLALALTGAYAGGLRFTAGYYQAF